MGQEITQSSFDKQDFTEFHRRLVAETKLLQQWMDDGLLETDEPMAGSELEAWLVDDQGQAAAVNQVFLSDMNDPMVVPELSAFNVELNTQPRHYGDGMFDRMHAELEGLWQKCEKTAQLHGVHMLMIGILPTVRQSALCLGNISPMQRYQALNEQVLHMRNGEPLRIDIRGRQHLLVSHEDVMLEAATTSLQLHLKVSASKAARAYNLSKMISAPMVALSANSPYLFGRDLWEETRIPLFEQSVAVGASAYSKRVTFGVSTRPPAPAKPSAPSSRSIARWSVSAFPYGVRPDLSVASISNTMLRWVNTTPFGVNEPHAILGINIALDGRL